MTQFLPDPDLIIRTSGEVRISNFFLWQSAFSEFDFVKCFWPDFNRDKFIRCLNKYKNRDRRYGNINEYQSTAPIYGGNSGGPLFDFKGNLIGINTANMFDTDDGVAENVSYSIKLKTLDKLLKFINDDKTIPPITLPSSTELSEKELTEQIKEISQYVVLIKVK